MSTVQLEIFFQAVDTFYFKGSRPHSAAGASSLPSDFPPAASTLSGTVRTRLGDALGVDWKALKDSDGKAVGQEFAGIDVAALIGSAADTGLLEFGEVRLHKAGKRLYPAPAVILKTPENKLVRLQIGDAVQCDLGNVRLPQLPEGMAGAKPLDDCWLTQAGFNTFLQGGLPTMEQVVSQEDLLQYESRLGIGRDVATASVQSGLLYQTEHLRMADDVQFSMVVALPKDAAELLQQHIQQQPLQRFGGEGRMAHLSAKVLSDKPLTVNKKPSLLMLLTEMKVDTNFAQQPLPGFTPAQHEGVDVWEGEINNVKLRLHTVVSGKVKRFGGWDIRHNQPREVQSYIPAGSCFYVEPLEGGDVAALQGAQVGERLDFGYGTLVCAK